MHSDELIDDIINGFKLSNQRAITGYDIKNNYINTKFTNLVLNEIFSLFDSNIDNFYRIEIKKALNTILSWYVFYNKCHTDIPRIQLIRKELDDIATLVDNLLCKLHKSSVVTKSILRKSVPSNSAVIDHHWFINSTDQFKLNIRKWSGAYTLRNRYSIMLRACELLNRYFKNTNEEAWHRTQIRFILNAKRREQELENEFIISKNFIKHIAFISSFARNRSKQLEIDRLRLTNQKQPGEHSTIEIMWPSPDIFLMKECGLLLLANNWNFHNFSSLAGLVHAQYLINTIDNDRLPFGLSSHSLKKFIKGWKLANRAKIRRWLDLVKPHVGGFFCEEGNGQSTPCLFPSPVHFPTFVSPTILHCLQIESVNKFLLENSIKVQESDGPEERKEKERINSEEEKKFWRAVRNGPGWEKICIGKNRRDYLPVGFM